MPQIFHSSTNVLSKVSIVVGAIAPLAIIMAFSAITRSSYNTKVGVALDQPVPFSHEHHVNELGIDCRYCHTSVEKSPNAGIPATETCMSCHSQIWTNSPLLEPVRESWRTGQSIQWNRVNKVPDFVYFNHSIHIKKGVSCNYCHGPVHAQQLTAKGKAFEMKWCLDCHRDPEKYIIPSGEVWALYQRIQRGEVLEGYEHNLAVGVDVPPPARQVERGKALVQEYNIKKDQLSDCWICHR